MSLYRIFVCSLQPQFARQAGLIISKKSFCKSILPAIVKIPRAHYCQENERNAEIVYVGPLSKQIKRVKLFSLITSMSGLFAQPVIYERAQELQVTTPVLVGLCSFVGVFTFITPLLLHFVTKKYVTLITYDKKNDSFTATVLTLFLRRKKITFLPGEAKVPDVLGLFTSMEIRGTPLFIDAKFFEDVNYYKKIMGYDKPLDFKLSSPEKPTPVQ